MQRHNPNNLYRFICDFKRAHGGVAPTLREIGDATGVASTSNVKKILVTLESQGKIKMLDNTARAIMIIGETWSPPNGS